MHWPQITIVVLAAISGTVTLLKHGEPKGNYSFGLWTVAATIEFFLLYKGGFFG